MIKLFSLKQQKKEEESAGGTKGSSKKASAAQLRIQKGRGSGPRVRGLGPGCENAAAEEGYRKSGSEGCDAGRGCGHWGGSEIGARCGALGYQGLDC